MRLGRKLLPVMAAGLLAACTQAPPPAPMIEAQPLRARVEAELLVEDGAPSVTAIAELGAPADVGAVLAELAADPSEAPLARHRALALIADFPSPRGRELLARVRRDGATPFARSVAARALGRLDSQER